MDVIIGTVEEKKALKSSEQLMSMIEQETLVLRDGKEYLVDSKELVVGDIVLLESGDHISADMRILECSNLQVDESVLTGESVGVSKSSEKLPNKDCSITQQSNMLFAGCSIVTGRCRAIVVNTGINTMVGNIFETVSNIINLSNHFIFKLNLLLLG